MQRFLQHTVIVTRGLDPRVHLLRKMDCRVKPDNDHKGAA